MFAVIAFVSSYLKFYHTYLLNHWHHMTPEKYGILLISIGFFGWLLMKNCSRAGR